jgi:hypothetical protein
MSSQLSLVHRGNFGLRGRGFLGFFDVPWPIPLRTKSVVAGLEKTSFPSSYPLYILAYTHVVNANIYMKFSEAVDSLCSSLNHGDVAKALGVSVQAVRQARLNEESSAFRAPPKSWKAAIIKLAEARVLYYRKLVNKLKAND